MDFRCASFTEASYLFHKQYFWQPRHSLLTIQMTVGPGTFCRVLRNVACMQHAAQPWLQACSVPAVVVKGTEAINSSHAFLLGDPNDFYIDCYKGRSRKPWWKRSGGVKKYKEKEKYRTSPQQLWISYLGCVLQTLNSLLLINNPKQVLV